MAKKRTNVYPIGPTHWKVCWYVPNGPGRRKRKWSHVRGDLQTAVQLQAKFQSDAEARARGLIDPAAEKLAKDARTPIAEHIADFEAALQSRRTSEKYILETVNAVTDTARRCGWRTIADIEGPKLSSLLASLASKDGVSARTLNKRRMACRMFAKWLWQEQRLRTHPLSNVRGARESDDRRRVRRALSADEQRRLLAATLTQRRRSGLDGPSRSALYRLMLTTGLRVGEVVTLKRVDLKLDDAQPVVKVQAAYSKRRRIDHQPLPPETVHVLRELTADLRPTDPVWPSVVARSLNIALRRDLDAARAAWIEETPEEPEREVRRATDFLAGINGEGEVVDMHALRHSFVSGLVRGGASPKVAQTLARHSTPTLTLGVYAHAQLDEVRAGMDALPTLDLPGVPSPERRPAAKSAPAPERSSFRACRGLTEHAGGHRSGDFVSTLPEALVQTGFVTGWLDGAVLCSGSAGVAELADAADSKSAAL